MIFDYEEDAFRAEQARLWEYYHGANSERSEEDVAKLRRFVVEMQTPINRKNLPSFVKEAWQVNEDELPF